MASPEELRRKVDGLLHQALAERDHEARTKLIGKATYWNSLAGQAQAPPVARNPWSERQTQRRA